MKKIDRRGFLRTGLAGAATMAAASTGVYAVNALPARENIIYRTLGKTGLRVPVVSMGVMRADNPSLVKAAMENGIVHFDTANGYQGGRNETMLGEVWKGLPRDSFIVATKVKPAGEERGTGLPTDATTAEDFIRNFEESLTRLQLEYVDILYVHAVSTPEMANHKELVKAVRKLKKDGKTKFIGISTHSNEVQVIDTMIKAGFWDVVLTRYNFNLSYLDELNGAIDRAAKAGMGIVAMKTMAGGWFDRERTKPINPTAALKWALNNPNIHTSIPGMTSFEMLEEDVKVLSDITMTEQEKRDILIASAEPGLFCTTCNSCLSKCTRSLPVPDMMRAYMYAYGYADISLAHGLIADLGVGTDPCSSCDDCTIECTKGFDVRTKIADISRLSAVPADFIV